MLMLMLFNDYDTSFNKNVFRTLTQQVNALIRSSEVIITPRIS